MTRPAFPTGLHTALKPGEQSFPAHRPETRKETNARTGAHVFAATAASRTHRPLPNAGRVARRPSGGSMPPEAGAPGPERAA
jgi:hypothetical protein